MQDEVRGEVEFVGIKDLAKAIRREAVLAVAYWWGVTPQTVTKWRRRLGIKKPPKGTQKLRQAWSEEPFCRRGQRLAVLKASDPERCAKIAGARRGKPRPPHVVEAVRQAHLGMRHTDEARRKVSEAQRRRGAWPPKAGMPWSAKEDGLLRKLSTEEITARTGRTLAAIYCRWRVLGLAKRIVQGKVYP